MAKLLNWAIFYRKLKEKNLIIFTPTDIRRIFGVSKVAATFLVHRYTKQGLLKRVKQGIYTLYDTTVPDLYLANKLYEPSYVSLEFALSYHRVIPETVYEITSVTTKATRRFNALGKVFTYRKIKKEAFTGYSVNQQKGLTFLIAEPEKAFIDLTYLRIISNKKPISRFNKEKINQTKALRYAKLFNNNKLISIIKTTL
ncbi:MAG: type IV toxin-antitoxin system AbiEi family antitoxin domain-containing protein [Minisyncoccales bacterium]